mmetsp:Transcript_118584/g.336197  ORF Transcript_118584/g.336197 Transcript_118584/m.336197 type:complete len:237 (-) Transcript_118584:965-1675(-)
MLPTLTATPPICCTAPDSEVPASCLMRRGSVSRVCGVAREELQRLLPECRGEAAAESLPGGVWLSHLLLLRDTRRQEVVQQREVHLVAEELEVLLRPEARGEDRGEQQAAAAVVHEVVQGQGGDLRDQRLPLSVAHDPLVLAPLEAVVAEQHHGLVQQRVLLLALALLAPPRGHPDAGHAPRLQAGVAVVDEAHQEVVELLLAAGAERLLERRQINAGDVVEYLDGLVRQRDDRLR